MTMPTILSPVSQTNCFTGLCHFPSVKKNQHTLFSTCMFKNASPTKTMSLFMRLLEEQKYESLYIIHTIYWYGFLPIFFSQFFLWTTSSSEQELPFTMCRNYSKHSRIQLLAVNFFWTNSHCFLELRRQWAIFLKLLQLSLITHSTEKTTKQW